MLSSHTFSLLIFFPIYQVSRILTECFDTEYLTPLLLPHVNDVTLPGH
jgi:hypothetical protein